MTTPEQELLVKYFLSRILEKPHKAADDDHVHNVSQRRTDDDATIVYPQVKCLKIKTFLDLAFPDCDATSGEVVGEGQAEH